MFQVGDVVTTKSLWWPWQSHFEADPKDLELIPGEMKAKLPLIFSCLGLIGLTVLLGIRNKGKLNECKPESGY